MVMKLVFEIRDTEGGGYFGRAAGHAIYTQADSWGELCGNVLEVTTRHFAGALVRPRVVQLHYVKDELISID